MWVILLTSRAILAADGYVPFEGPKTAWHEGFDRYDFTMNDATGAITPMTAPASETTSFEADRTLKDGKRRCVVVVPRNAAPGYPWSWRGCYWNHQPQTEVELLKRGFHIAYVAPDPGRQGKAWDRWYVFLTEKHGLSKKAAFIGMSKGGVNEFNWGVVNADKVACIYADNPALYDEDFAKVSELARHDIPLLHVCGSEDFLLQRHTLVVENTYQQLGGLITVMIKQGHPHHPHSLQNPKPIADWIEQHMTPSMANRPAFADASFAKGYYYSLNPSFIYLKEEDSYAMARGPGFTPCYDRYDAPGSGTFKTGGMSIIVPNTVAPGKPWVLTGDPIERDASVEQALLAKGYHVVTVAPTGSGMSRKDWDDTYKLLVNSGFSKKPVLKGTGPKAAESYAWAVANPDKVSCIYARNPFMHSLMAGKEQPIDNLAVLAKAGVPVLHDCGASDPWLDSQTRVVEKRYQDLGGRITVIVREGEGHFPLSPKDPKSVVDFILENARVASTGAVQATPATIAVKGDAHMFLYGGGAASKDDCFTKQAGDSFRWKGSGQVTWKVQVDRAGDYELALCHAAEPGAVGQLVQVGSGDNRVTYTLAMTKGVFGNKSYELTPIKGRLHLEAGTQSITLSIPDAPKAMNVLAFRSLELTPVAAAAVIEADRQEARRARAGTDWLVKAGYGLMFHWTSQSIGRDGTHKSYARAVDDFDVNRFAEMVEATGAGYVIVTIGHAESYCPAPLGAWEKYHPGKTTRRDLIAEMADALNAKGIKLMCYLNAASLTGYPKVGEEQFTRIMTEIVSEFGDRYRDKVAGYWFDCCYQAKEKYPGFSFREFFKTCKVGNPDRIVALNSWIYPNVSEWQEYWAGESGSLVGLPRDGTTQERGPGAGLRYHALLIMEPYWVQQKVEMPRPRFTAQELGDYIDRCKANGGAVTINLGIYQDGTVDPQAVEVLQEVGKRIRGTDAPAPGQSPAR